MSPTALTILPDLMVLASRLSKLLADKEWQQIDLWLAEVDVKVTPMTDLVTLLRMTAPVRSLLPSWGDCCERAREALDARGFNSQIALRGLL